MRLLAPKLDRRDGLLVLVGIGIATTGFLLADVIHHAQIPLRPQTATVNSPWIPPTVTRWRSSIDTMAKKYHVDPTFMAIIMTMESGGNPAAVSPDNAQGLLQITPLTAQDIAKKYLKQPVTHYNLLNPQTNIEFGAAYMSYLRNTFGDSSQAPSWNVTAELVAAGYNGGPSAAYDVATGKGLTNTQTVVYSRDAYNMWRERHASSSPTYDRWLERGGSSLIDAAKTKP